MQNTGEPLKNDPVIKAEKIKNLESKISEMKREIETTFQKIKSPQYAVSNEELVSLENRIGEYDELVKELENLSEKPHSFNSETFHSEIKPFLLETFKDKWSFNAEQMEKAQKNIENPEILSPEEYYKKLSEIAPESADDTENVGKITSSTEQIEDDLEKIKTTIINPSEEPWYKELQTTLGRTPELHEVFAQLSKQYPNKTPAGLDFYTKALKLAELDPEKARNLLGLKKGESQFLFCPGSSVCDEDGYWMSPFVHWRGDDFDRNASRLRDGWGDNDRVVLLER
jgi:hypothetical protein